MVGLLEDTLCELRRWVMSQEARTRGERLQIMLTPEELVLIDDFQIQISDA